MQVASVLDLKGLHTLGNFSVASNQATCCQKLNIFLFLVTCCLQVKVTTNVASNKLPSA